MKKVTIIGVMLLTVCLLCGPCLAANTIKSIEGSVTISSIDSDYTFATTFPNSTSGLRMVSIRFNPGAADDICVIKNGSDTGSELFNSGKCVDEYDVRIEYYNSMIRRPYLDFSAGTYSSGSTVTFEFDY